MSISVACFISCSGTVVDDNSCDSSRREKNTRHNNILMQYGNWKSIAINNILALRLVREMNSPWSFQSLPSFNGDWITDTQALCAVNAFHNLKNGWTAWPAQLVSPDAAVLVLIQVSSQCEQGEWLCQHQASRFWTYLTWGKVR